MKQSLNEYARIGFVHHMLYPESAVDADYHARTLMEFADRQDMETFDCCLPYGDERRESIIKKLKGCSKDITYALHLFPSRKISLASRLPGEQGLIRVVVKDQIKMAAAIGAREFIFTSGADLPDDRENARKCFMDFCLWFCSELAPFGIYALLEPFDRTVDKKFLYGPLDECIELVQDLSKRVDNIGIELDFAHLPLMGEEFDSAVQKTAPFLKRVHLGNCVLKDKNNPLYGDRHPPVGIEGGEIDTKELAVILESLLRYGYLGNDGRGALVIEMIPFPGKTSEYTAKDSLSRLYKAWSLI